MNFFTRLSNGWNLAMNSFAVLKANRQLILFPILSGISMVLVISSFVVVALASAGWDIDSFREKELLEEFASFSKPDWQGATWPPNVVHIELWDMVGGYSTEFSPGMYSDPDFSMKLWKAGVRVFKGIGSSRIYHFGSKSVGRIKKNKGYYTFIAKWGMTSSTFTRCFLRSGEPFDGELIPPLLTRGMRWKNLYKRVLTAFNKC